MMNKGKLIENNNFIDLPLEGSAYRWFRYSDIPSKFSSLGLTEIWFQKVGRIIIWMQPIDLYPMWCLIIVLFL